LLRQQISKRGADGHLANWPGSVKVSDKKFFTDKITHTVNNFIGVREGFVVQIKDKNFLPGT
jgi:hypothetical protein